MDIKLKYKSWVGQKHADIARPLTNSDIETYAIEFVEWLVKNLAIPDVRQQSELLKAFANYYNSDEYDSEMSFDTNINKFLKDFNCD